MSSLDGFNAAEVPALDWYRTVGEMGTRIERKALVQRDGISVVVYEKQTGAIIGSCWISAHHPSHSVYTLNTGLVERIGKPENVWHCGCGKTFDPDTVKRCPGCGREP